MMFNSIKNDIAISNLSNNRSTQDLIIFREICQITTKKYESNVNL